MEALPQQLLNGLVLGSLYVMVALGLTLIYGVLVQINFAHAEFMTLGAFGGFFLADRLGLPYLVSVLGALVIGALLGVLIEYGIFRPLRRREDDLAPLIATVGIAIVIQNLALAWFGPIPLNYSSPYQQVIRLGPLFITGHRVLVFGLAAVSIGGLFYFIRRTYLGKAMRAVSQDQETAGLMGINASSVILLTFVIGSALAGMGGALLGPLLVLTPYMGAAVIVKAFAIVILGGFGNVEGTILAGLLVGIIEAIVSQFLDPGMIDIIVFALLLATLAIRPTGLIAERVEENV